MGLVGRQRKTGRWQVKGLGEGANGATWQHHKMIGRTVLQAQGSPEPPGDPMPLRSCPRSSLLLFPLDRAARRGSGLRCQCGIVTTTAAPSPVTPRPVTLITSVLGQSHGKERTSPAPSRNQYNFGVYCEQHADTQEGPMWSLRYESWLLACACAHLELKCHAQMPWHGCAPLQKLRRVYFRIHALASPSPTRMVSLARLDLCKVA